MHIHSLYLYPIKSCASIRVNHFTCDALGPIHDREWMVVDESGNFLTQREEPRLALVKPKLTGNSLEISASGFATLTLPLQAPDQIHSIEIWGDKLEASAVGALADSWFSEFLGRPARLVQAKEGNRIKSGEHARSLRFADSFPLHLASLSSLADLNQRLPTPIGIERFRANIVIAESPPWAEDNWTKLTIAGQDFAVGKRTDRCVITTINQDSADKSPEPLKTLASFRRNSRNKIEFGVYLQSRPGIEMQEGMPLVGIER